MLHRFVRIIKTVKFKVVTNMIDAIGPIPSRPSAIRQADIQQVADVDGKLELPWNGSDGKFGGSAEIHSIRSAQTDTPQAQEYRSAVQSETQFQNDVIRNKIVGSQQKPAPGALMTFSTTPNSKSDGGIIDGIGKAFIEGSKENEVRKEEIRELSSGELTPAKVLQLQTLSYDQNNRISQMNGLVKRAATIIQDTLKAQ